MSNESLSEQELVRREKLKLLKELSSKWYRNDLKPTHKSFAIINKFGAHTKEQLEQDKVPVSIAGRAMAVRRFGKACFIQVYDDPSSIQIYLRQADLDPKDYEIFDRCLDIGDIVYAKGFLFRTKTNELTVHCESFQIITKALRPMPEKFHGLTDVETKYRQRYVDLISSEETRMTFYKRSHLIQKFREFFLNHGFLEVETPMMHPIAGGAAAKPFVTHHNTLDVDLFLRIAPELYLKRLIVGGFYKVFEINRNFRNEGMSIKHNPEFTMCEFYWAFADYHDLMDYCEELFRHLCKETNDGNLKIQYGENTIDFEPKFRRLALADAVREFAKVTDPNNISELEAALTKKGVEPLSRDIDLLQVQVFDECCEQYLIQPTFITHYPTAVSPLSRKNDVNPKIVDRFELFINGWEISNAFSELNDPQDQMDRFVEQARLKSLGNEEACDIDEDYVTALEYGMPATAGAGIGIDRLAMLLTNSPSIRDVILFPQMRPRQA